MIDLVEYDAIRRELTLADALMDEGIVIPWVVLVRAITVGQDMFDDEIDYLYHKLAAYRASREEPIDA